jgi:asparagine N-glycosylation enzyme membrane subunit Stt3
MKNERKTIIIVLMVVLVLLLLGNFRIGMMGGYYSGFMLLGWIINIVIIALIIIGVYWLIRHINYDGKNIIYNKRRQK